MDVASTLSTIMEVPIVMNLLGIDFFSNSKTTNLARLLLISLNFYLRAGRASKVSSRATKVIRVVRLVRLIRIAKLYKYGYKLLGRKLVRIRTKERDNKAIMVFLFRLNTFKEPMSALKSNLDIDRDDD
jgi:hypothetical protein